MQTVHFTQYFVKKIHVLSKVFFTRLLYKLLLYYLYYHVFYHSEVSSKALTGAITNNDVPMDVEARCGEFYHTGLIDEVIYIYIYI